MTRRPGGGGDETLPTSGPWANFESLRLTTADGEELGAWFRPGEPDRPVVVILHGIGARRSWMVGPAGFFAESNCGLLLVSLRAHGDSTGGYNDFGYSSRHDLVSAVDWIRSRHPERKVVVWGTSMGAATACFAAEELGSRVDGYFLESCYADLRIATRNRTKMFLPPIVEWAAYQGLTLWAPVFLPELDRIAPVRCRFPADVPFTVAAGGFDVMAKPEESAAITERIGPSAKLVIFETGHHSMLGAADPERYRAEVAELLARALASRAP